MEAENLPVDAPEPTKEEVCKRCIKSSKLLDSGINSTVRSFPMVSSGGRAEITRSVSKINYDLVADFEFRGIHAGRIALYETLIRFKKTNLKLKGIEKTYFDIKLQQVMETIIICADVLDSETPTVVACYSPQYAVTGAFAAVCKQKGVNVIFMEGSGNIAERESNLRLWAWDEYGLTQPGMSYLPDFDVFELTRAREMRAHKQLVKISQARSHSVYSSKKAGVSVFEYFNFDKSKKLLLLSMSSYDEVFSAYILGAFPEEKYVGQVFRNQIEWVRETIKWAARNEVQLLIRPHPREFPNKRESIKSEHTDAWSEILQDLPSCVRLDHPDLGLSIYDHFREIDAITTGWSFTGIEAMCEGIPLVTYDSQLPSYPASIHLSGESQAAYEENLMTALFLGKSKEIEKNGLRWISFLSERGTIEILSSPTRTLNSLSKVSFRNRYLNYAFRRVRGLLKRVIAWMPPSNRDLGRLRPLFSGDAKDLYG